MRIRPRQALAGPQLGGWTPHGSPRARRPVRHEPDVEIVLRDGTRLRGDVYRPETDRPVPGLLGWSPYNKDLMPTGLPAPFVEPGAVAYLAAHGYAVAVVSARGTARSEGELGAAMFDEVERADLVDTVAWLAGRPWCDGQVGMTGMSYFAISQLVAAAERPPALRAIFPFGAATDVDAHLATHQGARQPGFLGRYTAINGAAQRVRLAPSVRQALGYVVGTAPVQRLVRRVMRRAMPLLVARAPSPAPWMRRWTEYALPGARHPRPRLEDIEVPVLIGSEWSMVGLHLFGAFDAWARLRVPRKLLVGPRWPDWPWWRFQDELLAFYDHVLLGVDNGYAELPAVRYWLHGAERWASCTDWPPPDSASWSLALRGERLVDEPPVADEERSWVAVPVGMEHPGALERAEALVLRYEGDPVSAPCHLAGPADLTLPLRSTAIDTAVQARLSVVDRRGRTQVVSVGWLAAAHRAVDDERSTPTEIAHRLDTPVPLVPGRTETVRFSLAPFAHELAPGDRLRLEIGSDPQRLAPSDDFVHFQVAGPPYPARNTVEHRGAALHLTVRPGA